MIVINILLVIVLITLLAYRYFFPPIPPRKDHYKYALVLGCPNHDDGTMSNSQVKRCKLAMKAYKEGLYDTLIISGSNVRNQYVESEEMNKYIQSRMHIPVILEKSSKNTFQNFENSKSYVKDADILILTSQTHIKRACAIAKEFFPNYSGYWYKDLTPEHIFREIISRHIYIRFRVRKKIKAFFSNENDSQ